MMRRGMFRPRPRRRRTGRWLLLLALGLPLFTLLQVLALRWIDPPTSAFMLAHRGPVQYEWRDLADISRELPIAVVAAEDQKFPHHDGFDVDAIRQALDEAEAGERARGASTISQQVAKNLFLWPGGGYVRKGIEAGFTVLIEKLWSKERILEVYLNIAEFGPGIYGVEAASQAFFKKPAAKLQPFEAARLAAVLPSPRRWRAASPGPYVQARAGWIQRQMGYGRPAPDEPEPLAPEAGPESLPPPEESFAEPAPSATPIEPELSEPQPVPDEMPPSAPDAAEPTIEPLPGLEPEPIEPAPVPQPEPEAQPAPADQASTP